MGIVTAPVVARSVQPTESERANQQVHLNVPTLLWRAVAGLAEATGSSMTNVVVRALNREAYFWRVFHEDPNARVWVERSNGDRSEVVFL